MTLAPRGPPHLNAVKAARSESREEARLNISRGGTSRRDRIPSNLSFLLGDNIGEFFQSLGDTVERPRRRIRRVAKVV
jgi:hypothetical protein